MTLGVTLPELLEEAPPGGPQDRLTRICALLDFERIPAMAADPPQLSGGFLTGVGHQRFGAPQLCGENVSESAQRGQLQRTVKTAVRNVNQFLLRSEQAKVLCLKSRDKRNTTKNTSTP